MSFRKNKMKSYNFISMIFYYGLLSKKKSDIELLETDTKKTTIAEKIIVQWNICK